MEVKSGFFKNIFLEDRHGFLNIIFENRRQAWIKKNIFLKIEDQRGLKKIFFENKRQAWIF